MLSHIRLIIMVQIKTRFHVFFYVNMILLYDTGTRDIFMLEHISFKAIYLKEWRMVFVMSEFLFWYTPLCSFDPLTIGPIYPQ